MNDRASGLELNGLRTAIRGPYTITLPAGRCTVLSGPSGAGKSLLLRMIADLDPNQGTVTLDGEDRAAMPAPRWRCLVAYVPAEPGWWAPRVRGHMADLRAAAKAFPVVGLPAALMDAPVTQLSTGERQRAALVRAIVGRPRFLLLDEPTASLDPATTGLVEDQLTQLLHGGTGILLVSHNAEQARRMAHHRLSMGPDGLAAGDG